VLRSSFVDSSSPFLAIYHCSTHSRLESFVERGRGRGGRGNDHKLGDRVLRIACEVTLYALNNDQGYGMILY
jgi:hypothetical protein